VEWLQLGAFSTRLSSVASPLKEETGGSALEQAKRSIAVGSIGLTSSPRLSL
jgi:hypothetical protein